MFRWIPIWTELPITSPCIMHWCNSGVTQMTLHGKHAHNTHQNPHIWHCVHLYTPYIRCALGLPRLLIVWSSVGTAASYKNFRICNCEADDNGAKV